MAREGHTGGQVGRERERESAGGGAQRRMKEVGEAKQHKMERRDPLLKRGSDVCIYECACLVCKEKAFCGKVQARICVHVCTRTATTLCVHM